MELYTFLEEDEDEDFAMVDTRDKHAQYEESFHRTLVAKLLEIARFWAPNDKSEVWFENLSCLWLNANRPGALQVRQGTPKGCEFGSYIAVSYSWNHTPGLESPRNGKYAVTGTCGEYLRQSRVRDEVLFRVLRYAERHSIRRIWIDKECSPQKNDKKKQIAMDSMDLVYRHSKHPIGLLAVVLECETEIDFLEMLMTGVSVVQENKDEYPRLIYSPTSRTSLGILSVLAHLHTDRWWTRAWIFQEEYLSSRAMQILIRCGQGVVTRSTFGDLQGEICLNATTFREQATLFLLALKREAHHTLAKRCTKMLRRFGRYETQYRFQHDAKKESNGTENICGYPKEKAGKSLRPEMLPSGHSVELCLLAMYLLNGEIMRNNRDIKKLPREMDISNYMQYISFNKFNPPVKEKHLSYLKACRFHQVFLHRDGLSTKGHLWLTDGILLPSKWPRCPRRSRKCHGPGLNDFQRDRLLQLAEVLRYSSRKFLAAKISSYLASDIRCPKLTPAKRHMDIMAECVVEAIRTGTPLQTAGTQSSISSCGIFVGIQDPNMGFFTSWHAGTDVDGRTRESHVSLGVEVLGLGRTPILSTVNWVNGLVFFKRGDESSVIFNWPRSWTE
ncbi:hypothetical protein Q7P37_009964 [Cladosporium fusiforme]